MLLVARWARGYIRDMRAQLICVVLFAAGCGGSFTCSIEDRVGTYLFHMEERSGGGCGPVPDQLITLGGSGGPGAGCTVTDETVSDDKCDLRRTMVCELPADDIATRVVGVTTQDAPNADAMSGTVTMTITSYSTGETLCVSTYDVTYTRQ